MVHHGITRDAQTPAIPTIIDNVVALIENGKTSLQSRCHHSRIVGSIEPDVLWPATFIATHTHHTVPTIGILAISSPFTIAYQGFCKRNCVGRSISDVCNVGRGPGCENSTRQACETALNRTHASTAVIAVHVRFSGIAVRWAKECRNFREISRRIDRVRCRSIASRCPTEVGGIV